MDSRIFAAAVVLLAGYLAFNLINDGYQPQFRQQMELKDTGARNEADGDEERFAAEPVPAGEAITAAPPVRRAAESELVRKLAPLRRPKPV